MGTITARKRKDGTIGYMARMRVVRDGEAYHETETFDRRPAAAAWLSRRERELSKPGAVITSKNSDPTTLGKVIDRYAEETVKGVGRTKAQVLKAIKNYDIANMPCSSIKAKDIVEFLQSLTAQPQTVGNYASHLGAIFAIARPMWGYRLDEQEIKDAVKVARRMGIITRSAQRDRRPTLDELDRLMGHFIERRKKVPQAMPMHKVIAFALFSTRRQEEITRIRWKAFQREHKRVLVRDMKHPGEKIGNHT
ncbi:integrase family protein [Rhizobium sp. PDO1-076]|nr:integrase family protein [Rhizobium sp. PDO1-076]